MQPPIFSYILAPMIYFMVKTVCDNTALYRAADERSDKFRATYYDTKDTFDFIVVGAGSAGAVVANRLATNNFTVLLLEAGGEPQPGQYIPSTSLLLLNKPEIDWFYLTEPQTKACLGSKNRQSSWSAGKGLGGTSLLNFMQYLRGHPKDYESWANITGDESWNYDGILPHFQKIENFRGEFENQDIHGHGGEVTVQPPPFVGMAEYFIQAGEELGYQRRDLNGKIGEGFSVMYNNIRNGRRLSSYNAFIEPIRDNPYLTIYKFAEATKGVGNVLTNCELISFYPNGTQILMSEDNEAYGVEYRRHGVSLKAFSTKEVIISSGLIGSPKLLMLSGIGPRTHLESLGMETKYDAQAVGKNVQDHLAVFLGPFLVDKPVTMLFERDVNSEAFSDFMQFGTGPLTSAGTMATALVSSSFAKSAGEGDWPDLQFILVGTAIYDKYDLDFSNGFNVRRDVLMKYVTSAKGSDSFQIIVSGNRPIQRGEIYLKSSNPRDPPVIDPKYLHNEQDLEILVEGVKKAMQLVENTTVFQSIGARFTTEIFPGCEEVEFRSDDYWRCFIKQFSVSMHHLTGSCSMGRADSKDAVVDSKLSVIGVQNLRVIDASIMPNVPNVNTNAPSMMIGQKGASEILKRWKDAENDENLVK